MTSRRLPGYDYGQPAGYFVTINSWKRQGIFSTIEKEKIVLTEFGKIIEKCWISLPTHFAHINLGFYSIMPDHIHGIIIINYKLNPVLGPTPISDSNKVDNLVGAKHASHLPSGNGTSPGSLSATIQAFRSASSRLIHEKFRTEQRIWQPSFYDRIIRNEEELRKITDYIISNPYEYHNHLNPTDFS